MRYTKKVTFSRISLGRRFGGKGLRPRLTQRGFTLSEMIVAATVLALFLTLAFGSIVPSFRIMKEAEDSLAAQREVVLAFDRLVTELGMLDRASLSIAPDCMAFLSDQPNAGNNPAFTDDYYNELGVSVPDRLWLKHVVFRLRDGHLWRREFDYGKGNLLAIIDPDMLPVAADLPGMSEKIYVKNTELFEVTSAGRSRILLKVRSVFRDTPKPAACEMTLQIQMRGGN